MSIKDVLAQARIINLVSTDKIAALEELVACFLKTNPELNREQILAGVEQREALYSSVVREGVAMPHVRLRMRDPVLLAIGRSNRGVNFLGDNAQPVRLVVMILSRIDLPESHLQVLATLSRLLGDDTLLEKILVARDTEEVWGILTEQAGEPSEKSGTSRSRLDTKITRLLLEQALSLCSRLTVDAVLVNCDMLPDPDVLNPLAPLHVIPIFREARVPEEYGKRYPEHLVLPELDLAKVGQIKLALFLAMAREWISRNQVVLFLLPGIGVQGLSNLDIIVIRERFKDIIHFKPERFGRFIRPAVLEAVIKIAFDIAGTGREGKKIGTIFVLGDHESVLKYSQQLIVNPFRRVPGDRQVWSILDLAVEEMVKELAQLDGAFVISGEGTIISAATYLGTGRRKAEIKKGLGARHQAAANISAVTGAIAVTVSETNGTVTLFQDGKAVITIEQVPREIKIEMRD
jgi:DNA integrity scanning protein DisA with diadenylate cyclase activity/mannitol/fructose-specific phosphotransferase system IIA component (Ntr-type)